MEQSSVTDAGGAGGVAADDAAEGVGPAAEMDVIERDAALPDLGREPSTGHGDGVGVESPARVAAVRASGLLEVGPEEAFDRLTRLAATILGTQLVFLTAVDDVRSFLKGAPDPVARCGPAGTWEQPAREAACQVVVDSGREVIVDDVSTDPRLRDLPAIRAFGVRAWMGVPLVDPHGRVLGNLCAMDTEARRWTEQDVSAMRTIARSAAGEVALRVALEESERHAEHADRMTAVAERNERVAQQHAQEAAELAETLQLSLVPAAPPEIPGVQIAVRFRPGGTGAEVLGDFWDVVPTSDGFGVVLGDVCGKGPAAARTTAMARSAVRTSAHTETDPVRVLTTLHDVLHVWFGTHRSFVTAVYATFRRSCPADDGTPPARDGRGVRPTWQVTVASGGHPPGFVCRADGSVVALEGGGLVLGITPDSDVAAQPVGLAPGDSLVLYTDGITESRRPSDLRQLDEDGVATVLQAAFGDHDAERGSGDLAEHLAGSLSEAAYLHAGSTVPDDAAVVVISIDPTSAPPTSTVGDANGPRTGRDPGTRSPDAVDDVVRGSGA